MMRKIIAAVSLMVLGASADASALSDLAREVGLTKYSAKRLESNIYEVTDYSAHYIVQTRYCYEYASFEDVVVTKDHIYFLSSNASCEVQNVFRK